jgi:hypothetical protein
MSESLRVVGTIVDTSALLQTVLWAAVSGLAVTFAFAIAILGAARFSDLRGEDRPFAAAAFAAAGGLGFLTVIGAIVFGVVVMTQK